LVFLTKKSKDIKRSKKRLENRNFLGEKLREISFPNTRDNFPFSPKVSTLPVNTEIERREENTVNATLKALNLFEVSKPGIGTIGVKKL